jgi:hypothetical protein
MSQLRFNHVFISLLALSALCAFVIPMQLADVFRGKIDGILDPVASPVRRIAQAASARLGGASPTDPESNVGAGSAETQREIERLRTTVTSLTLQLEEMRRVAGDRQQYGNILKYCRPFKALGGDSSWRKSLTLRGDSHGLLVGMPVVCRQGLVGRISSVGFGSAQTRLITEKGFVVTAAFWRPAPEQKYGGILIPVQPPPLVEGRGDGVLVIANLTAEAVKAAKLAEGDLVVVDDLDLPRVVLGQTLGKIERIGRLAKEPLLAEIVVRPRANLEQLSEVMAVISDASEAK